MMTELCMGCLQNLYSPVVTNPVIDCLVQSSGWRVLLVRIYFKGQGTKMMAQNWYKVYICKGKEIIKIGIFTHIGVVNRVQDYPDSGRAWQQIAIQVIAEVMLYIQRSQSGNFTQIFESLTLKIMSAITTCWTKNRAQRSPLQRQAGCVQGLASNDGAENRLGVGNEMQWLKTSMQQKAKQI